MSKLQSINVNQNGALQNMAQGGYGDYLIARAQGKAHEAAMNQAQSTNAVYSQIGNLQAQTPARQPTIDEQIETLKRQIETLENNKRKELAPTNDQMRDYPAIDEAWKEFITIRNLTLGQK